MNKQLPKQIYDAWYLRYLFDMYPKFETYLNIFQISGPPSKNHENILMPGPGVFGYWPKQPTLHWCGCQSLRNEIREPWWFGRWWFSGLPEVLFSSSSMLILWGKGPVFFCLWKKNIHFLLDFVGLQHVWLWCVHCHVKAPIHMADKQETTRWLFHFSTCSTDLSLWKTNECPLKINGWFRCISYWKSPSSLGDMLDILHHLRCIKTLQIMG